jgi:hypothetical protein
MTVDDRAAWILSAVDSLGDIRASEVKGVSAEVRRSVTRHSQIVPEIVRLVVYNRANAHRSQAPQSPYSAEMAINQEAELRRKAACGRDEIEAAFEWERAARNAARLSVRAPEPPFRAQELENMSPEIVALGMKLGFMNRQGKNVVEVLHLDAEQRAFSSLERQSG